jgi:hypothetical protein
MKNRFRFLSLAILFAVLPTVSLAQSDVDSQIEQLRADFRADKVQLISQAMNFSESDSKIFWPIYKKYDADLAALNDKRVALIKDYANKYSTMSDTDAKALLDKAMNFDAERVELRKRYAKEFEKAGLPGLTTAKFFQLEHRLDSLVDLKLASQLPSLLVRNSSK